MPRYVLRRVAGILLVLVITSLAVYLVFLLSPSDPARLSCGRPCAPQTLTAIRAYAGYDQPVLVQWLHFLVGLFAGRSYGSGGAAVECAAPCLGYSFARGETVGALILERAPVTFSIAIGAAIVWVVVGVGTGVLSALRRGTVLDRSAMVVALAGVSAPAYLVGLVGLAVFGFGLDMVPVNGYVPLTEDPVEWAWHLVLPWCTLAFLSAAVYARLTRGQMLETLGEDFIRTARAKGLTARRVVARHGLRAALPPIITVFGLDLGALLGGSVIIEQVFSMQGLGRLLIDSVQTADLPVIVGVTLLSAALIVVANLVVDLVHAAIDPRAVLV